jgi:single-strand DNA-binding protein
MASLNKITLIGNVGSDPEMRYTPNGKAVTSFRMATNYRYTGSDGERREETEWFRVSVWASKLKAVINSYPKEGEFMLKEGYILAIGKGKMGRCVLVLKCQQTE